MAQSLKIPPKAGRLRVYVILTRIEERRALIRLESERTLASLCKHRAQS